MTPKLTTPVTVVTGCLGCPWYREHPPVPISPDWTRNGLCVHRAHHKGNEPGLDTRKSDTPPDWCPLPKLSDTVEVRPS